MVKDLCFEIIEKCLNNNPESVEILIKNGANIWLKNNFNESALTHAVMSNCIECLRIIKDNYL